MKIIASRDNPLFKQLRGLIQDPRDIKKLGKTVLDGPHLVAGYRQSIGLPELLVVSESGLARNEIQQLLADHQPLQAVCFKDALFKELSPAESPAGILSLIPIPEDKDDTPSGDCLLLDALQDAGNVGTLLRTAAAFGVNDVYLGIGCAGAWTPKVLRAAQGAHFSLRIKERCDLAAVLKSFKGMRLATVVQDAESLYRVRFEGAVAWAIGSEGRGLAPDLLALCDRRVTIPISNECESLNAAVAASICLAERARQKETHHENK